LARVALALYWHQHQPYYPDDVAGENLMPWVRLHGVKDYYGMGAILEEFPQFHCTVNFVPSLLVQLQSLIDGQVLDKPLLVAQKDADSLTEADVVYMLDHFFLVNPDVMIRPFPRYQELWQLRGAGYRTAQQAARRFKPRDLRDLQVWANLAWFHPISLERDAELRGFVDKGRDFTESQKRRVLDKQMQALAEVLPMHARLQERGQVELTASPFYHPILPLLWDKRQARESMPHVELPAGPMSYPEDATMHIRRGVAYHTRAFGAPPRGMWPSEGSVCQAIVPALCEAGIQWIATDEEILSRSLGGKVSRDRHGHVRHPELLYRPWRVQSDGQALQIVFRDHALSDLIGFQYQRVAAAAAAEDFVAKLNAIGAATPGDEVLVSVILDGENCWEFYPNQGLEFLRELYARVLAEPNVRPVRIGDYVQQRPAEDTLDHLFAGSWINHDFGIWIGHPEDNQAWDLLHRTREALKRSGRKPSVTEDGLQTDRAWEELFIAEGSDWFWWFGDDHSSTQDELFDRLFRTHLKNVYALLEMPAPPELDDHIKAVGRKAIHTMPSAFLDVKIDGRRTFFEWLNAGHYHCQSQRGTMAMVTAGRLSDVYFGFSEQRLMVRLDTVGRADEALADVEQIQLAFVEPVGYRLLAVLKGGHVLRTELVGPDGPVEAGGCESAVAQVVEMAVPFAGLGLDPAQPFRFFVELLQGDLSIERAPQEGTIDMEVPTADFEEIMWQV